MKIELHTNYTIDQLLALRTESGHVPLPKAVITAKKPIRRYGHFDSEHRQTYRAIHEAIAMANPGERFDLFAFGSRVSGRWRTDEESEGITPEGVRAKYSDWDVISTAPNRPTDEHLAAVGLESLRLDLVVSPNAKPKAGHIKIEPTLGRRLHGLWQNLRQAMTNPRKPAP